MILGLRIRDTILRLIGCSHILDILEDVSKWWKENVSADWYNSRAESYHILQREDTLKEIVRLLGPEALPDEEKLILEVARMIKIGILQQNSFDKVDTY